MLFSVESSVTFSYVIYSTGSEPASKQLELQKKAVPTFLRFFSFLFLNCAVKKTNSKFLLESFTAEDKSVKSVLNNFINSGKSVRWKPGPRKNKGNSAKTAPESTEGSETVVK